MARPLCLAAVILALAPAAAWGQPTPCPPAGWTVAQLQALKKDGFKIADTAARQQLAQAITACLADPNPDLRDGVAFEALTVWMRAALLDAPTLRMLRDDLYNKIGQADARGFAAPFAALVLAEVARTDRLEAWMTTAERETMVRTAAMFLAGVTDYRAFDDKDGFRHAVAHGADFALQLALNPALTKAHLDHLMPAIAAQVAPNANIAYWAGEPERLARPILFIAQRHLHSADEWKAWFAGIVDPKPLPAWSAAFGSELGLRKRHNVRAFLLSVYASANNSDDPAIRQLLGPARDSLKAVP